ncbi:hypothetical protein [Pseudarthrobacter sp. SSS035]|uniref:hypothetical protein n=1 Tax=Pseudarthrobacter sp. SSS035 TaxID=2931399 RepID=UPI00200DAFD8|nr:hypothetical protein [Pseudarthrobacter sp. SSS035]
MSQELTAAKRHGWPGTVLWALLIVASIILMCIGLWRAMFFGFTPNPRLVEDLRVGSLYILAGSAASLAAAVWSAVRGHPYWVTACVAAPAILVGGAALMAPTSLIRHLAAAVAFPLAVAALIRGLPYRGYRRSSKPQSS